MKKNIYIYFYYLVLRFVLFVIFLTCRWKVVQKEVLLNAVKSPQPLLLCLWHEQLVYVSRFFKNSSFNFYGIISTHFDAEIYSRILRAWNIKLIRGSSTRWWANVIKKMILIFKDSSSVIAVTNDGPKGPPRIAKEGSLSVAKKYNAQIVAVSAKASKYWRVGSWDKTFIPKPFSTVYILFSEPFDKGLSANSKNITNFININSQHVNNLK